MDSSIIIKQFCYILIVAIPLLLAFFFRGFFNHPPYEMSSTPSQHVFNALESLYGINTVKKYSKSGLYEVWFTMINDIDRNEAYWIRYTYNIKKGTDYNNIVNKKDDGNIANLWFGFFDAHDPKNNYMVKSKHKFFSVSGSDQETGKIVSIDGSNVIYLDGMKGEINVAEKDVSWDLSFHRFTSPYYPVPWFAYLVGITNTYLSVGHPNLKIKGDITVDNEKKSIKNAVGTQTHTFGDSYQEPWSWIHVNNFENHPNAFFEMGFKSRKGKGSLGFFDGKNAFFFNSIFSMFSVKEVLKTPTKVVIKADGRNVLINVVVTVDEDKLIGLEYVGPRGNTFYCYNSELGNMELTILDKSSGKETKYIAKHSVAFETVWIKPQEGLKYLKSSSEAVFFN